VNALYYLALSGHKYKAKSATKRNLGKLTPFLKKTHKNRQFTQAATAGVRQKVIMKLRFNLGAVVILLYTICFSAAAVETTCKASKQVLPEAPEDKGARSRNSVMEVLGNPELVDEIMAEPKCSRVGTILLELTIDPAGKAIHIKKLGSTFLNDIVEGYLFKIIPKTNVGKIDNQENSIFYVRITFQDGF
jgi:hypothetical protein